MADIPPSSLDALRAGALAALIEAFADRICCLAPGELRDPATNPRLAEWIGRRGSACPDGLTDA